MVFSSTVFLFIFFPITYILYLIFPSVKAKNNLLIVSSMIFYAFGEPYGVFLMIFMIIMNYFFALHIVNDKNNRGKLILTVSVIFNLLILCIFKYSTFFITALNLIGDFNIPIPEIHLPIGISFFTFQIISYIIDVYNDNSLVQYKISNLILYISFFPQLIAGPVVKYCDISQQIDSRDISEERIASGIRRFIYGLSKKVLIADTLGATVDVIFSLSEKDMSILSCWTGSLSYSLQIYFDFSGYSDMAIGLGNMFGFSFKENFNSPYTAGSIQSFWQRWNISVSSWFKDYLYIYLGGNCKSKSRTVFNKVIIFFFIGLWHDADVKFIVWGLIHGFFVILESCGVIQPEKFRFRFFRHIYTLLVVNISFVFFRADNISYAIIFIYKMFNGFITSDYLLNISVQQFTPLFIASFVIGIILCTPVTDIFKDRVLYDRITYPISILALLACIVSLSSSSFSSFIYFDF